MQQNDLVCVLEAILMSAEKPLSFEQIMKFFPVEELVTKVSVRQALVELGNRCEGRGFELRLVANGYRYQTREEYKYWVSKHWDEKPPRYSRALLETLALIVYRQPTTRAEIEEVRGVAVSSNIIKTLVEREWIRVVGHKEVPGRPELFGTTPQLLDYFNLKSLDELPSLPELKNLEEIYPELTKKEPVKTEE
ncbi:SMC-Scp complex subunit ScpB [Leucothrix sargassi]|nr:SMC-Scp complex subunit ScpB [Leucothrix sargassi]